MSELENDLRATGEDIAADATRLAEIEDEKAGLEADDPRLVEPQRRRRSARPSPGPEDAAESELAEEALATDGGAA